MSVTPGPLLICQTRRLSTTIRVLLLGRRLYFSGAVNVCHLFLSGVGKKCFAAADSLTLFSPVLRIDCLYVSRYKSTFVLIALPG